MSQKITITIDGQSIETEPGQNLVSVMRKHGIFVPSLCYYEHIEPPLGTCRVCSCEVDGRIMPACTTVTKEGMQVALNTEELTDTRKAIVEMMFAEGNHFCPGCEKTGNCDLQHMGYEMGMDHLRFPHIFKDRPIDFNPKRILIEHNRCVKCLRCVEEVVTDDGKKVFSFRHRGNETVVGIDYDEEARLSDEQAANAMRICPTGAIIVRGVDYGKPFGDRRFDIQSTRTGEKGVSQPMTIRPTTKKTVATASLAGCFGCHMSMLDIDLGLLDLIEVIDFNKSPLNDIKKFTKRCDIGLIEGGCCNSDNVEVLREFRKQCDILVSVGECAIWGGLPAMRNTIPLAECLEEAYLDGMTSEPGEYTVPYSEDLPKILDKVYACSDIVEIDHHIPGCPPNANHIWKRVGNLLWGEYYSVLYSEFKYD